MRQTIEQSLNRFIEDPQLKVLVLKGPWGVGKTFLWRSYWAEYSKSKESVRPYAYVSLFGLEDLDGLRSAIVSKAEFSDEKLSTKGIFKRCRNFVGTHAKDAEIPWLGNGQLISRIIEERALKNYMVCLDDFERRGAGLSVSTILGVVSELKEEKACKVVLIFNDGKMDKDSSDKFDEFREKVVDLELEYSPSVIENLQVVWSEEVPDYAREVFELLGQNNIRLMQKAKTAIDYFTSAIGRYSDELQASFCRNVVILTVLYLGYYTKEQVEVIISSSFGMLTWGNDDEEKIKLKELYKHVDVVKYYQQEFDRMIFEYLDRGYVDFERYEDILASGEKIAVKSGVDREFRAIWDGLHHGFSVKQDEFVERLISYVKEHYETLNLGDVCACDFILKEFEQENDEIAELVREKAVAVADSLDRFEWSDWSWKSIPREVIELIMARFNENQQVSFTISEAIEPLAGSNGWNPDEIIRLERFSEDDYYEWLLQETELDTPRLMREFRQRFSSDKKHGGAQAWQKMEGALNRIRSRSKADEIRVAGIFRGSST